jgi:type II secretion system protein G
VKRETKNTNRAFTLIELLIVVAIIAILAAIAVPNFLEAQVRSKVSRVKSDLRTMRTAVESYAVDNSRYPRTSWGCAPYLDEINGQLVWGTLLPSQITTPISYLSSLPTDPFAKNSTDRVDAILYTYQDPVSQLKYYLENPTGCPALEPGYVYLPSGYSEVDAMELYMGKYFLWSIGPAGPDQEDAGGNQVSFFQQYDPTNGTVSVGHVFVSQKSSDTVYVPISAF